MAKGKSKTASSQEGGGKFPESDPTEKPFASFTPTDLDRTIVSLPLLEQIKNNPRPFYDVIIEVNLDYPGGRRAARDLVWGWVDELTKRTTRGPRSSPQEVNSTGVTEGVNRVKSEYSQQYIFGRLSEANIKLLAEHSKTAAKEEAGKRTAGRTAHQTIEGAGVYEPDARPQPALYRIWLDHKVKGFISKSISTVKADAARNAFGTLGHEIVWAVVDTGIDGSHPHFKKHGNLNPGAPLLHRDFTAEDDLDDAELANRALVDKSGHGTHVAGIVAGELAAGDPDEVLAEIRQRDADGEIETSTIRLPSVSGMAPQCKLLSLKVLDDEGDGHASNLIAALEYLQELNGNGRRLRVHGVNMSVGYDFEPKWFACGQSPLCVEVDRLVQSGVVVVVAAGNTGYGIHNTASRGPVAAGLDLTINDPGNADLAITVGSTHREMPHIYGVSYFSSKGPTGDGRLKPDLVAPGEKIISCATQSVRVADGGGEANRPKILYKEDSGTSMAAPHVSGVIAAFLSVRREFIGQPWRVKDIFLSTATDLKRTIYFQGKGLVDLMRAIQSV